MTPPELLNDPIDCQPIHEPLNEDTARNLIKIVMTQSGHPGLGSINTEDIIRSIDSSRDLVSSAFEENIRKAIQNFGVLSVSTEYDNVLMWTHYAGGHTGVCIGLNSAKTVLSLDSLLLPIIYEQNRPRVDVLADNAMTIAGKTFFHKSPSWAYEREWRFIHEQHGVRTLPEDAIQMIILGARISNENRIAVMDWLTTRDKPISIYQARYDSEESSLKLFPCA